MSGIVSTDNNSKNKGHHCPLKHEVAALNTDMTTNAVIIADGKTDQSENCAGGTHRNDLGMPEQTCNRRSQSGNHVDRQKTVPADFLFQQWTNLIKNHHIKTEMDQPAMGKGIGDGAPPLPAFQD